MRRQRPVQLLTAVRRTAILAIDKSRSNAMGIIPEVVCVDIFLDLLKRYPYKALYPLGRPTFAQVACVIALSLSLRLGLLERATAVALAGIPQRHCTAGRG